MNNPAILPSTFLLTILLLIGLFFFIKASVKDRTQQIQLLSEQKEEFLAMQLQQYFTQRAYRITSVEATEKKIALEGFVRPSWFLAIFLTFLTAMGLFCLALVLSIVLPSIGQILLAIVLLAPFAGIFYWRKAGRLECVQLIVESVKDPGETSTQSRVTVTAHRDELIQLQQTLALRRSE